jgi:hypothetical protein
MKEYDAAKSEEPGKLMPQSSSLDVDKLEQEILDQQLSDKQAC